MITAQALSGFARPGYRFLGIHAENREIPAVFNAAKPQDCRNGKAKV
jgi:hypothetical protein